MSKPTTFKKTTHRGPHLTKATKRRVSKAARRATKPELVDTTSVNAPVYDIWRGYRRHVLGG